MKYIVKFAKYPKNEKVLEKIDKAAVRLEKKLSVFDCDSLKITNYDKIYLRNYQNNLSKILQINCHILAWCLNLSKNLKNFTLIDHGGGVGLLSLLAKESGIGKVIYNDIDEVQTHDAEIIAQALNIPVDNYFSGDIGDLISFLKRESIVINGLVSHDVIEHIYNVKDFIRKLSFLPSASFRVAMSSGANPYNPIISLKLMKHQRCCEFEDRAKVEFSNERDCAESFLKVRKKIIKNYNPELDSAQLQELATATRGMMKKDIETSVACYQKTKIIPKKLTHPTNTCDPFTGNWAEHLIDLSKFKKTMTANGFRVKILAGYWNRDPKSYPKKILTNLINILISSVGSKGIILAPSYLVVAKKKNTKS